MGNHHDTGYKELFSHPEFVQQLIEGFLPPEIAELMDFATLRDHSGYYVTPMFERKFEDVVWSVEVTWKGLTRRIFVYILLEFQSTVDRRMGIRLLHYVAGFYEHLLKTRSIRLRDGLPPILPIVLYNGRRRWRARQDIFEMIRPELPTFLRAYQPHLRYYLVDEGRYTDEELGLRSTPLSGVFSVENARANREALQSAVDRIVAIIQANPDKERIDRILTRWIKRHLERLNADINLEQLNSLVEDKAVLAENIENLMKKERQEGEKVGFDKGEKVGFDKGEKVGFDKGHHKGQRLAANNLLKLGVLSDEQIAKITNLPLAEIKKLRSDQIH